MSGKQKTIQDLVAGHKTLAGYLAYNEGNESPQIFHVWSFITAMSAAMGRKFWLADGPDRYYPNIYTLLVGAPAVRKSAAVKIARGMLSESTRVRLAPTDIAGQKQGLLGFIAEDYIGEDDEFNETRSHSRRSIDSAADLDALLESEIAIGSPLDRSSVFVAADEFASFTGISSSPLFTALIELYDCPDRYDYQLKRSSIIVDQPTLQVLAATTSSSLAQCLPPDIINQGFMSRVILVYAEATGRKLARRYVGNDVDRKRVLSAMEWAYYPPSSGAMSETDEAIEFLDKLYYSDEAAKRIKDSRLQYYVNRRHAHLRKLSMIIAVAELRTRIELKDVKIAHELLQLTEEHMPSALGEYGLSAEGKVRQRIIDYLVAQHRRIEFNELYQYMQADCPKRTTFLTIMEELVQAKKALIINDNAEGKTYFAHPHYMRQISGSVKSQIADLRVIN